MAIDGWSASNFIDVLGNGYQAFPVSISAWFKPTGFATVSEIGVCFISGTPTRYVVLYVATTSKLLAEAGGVGGPGNCASVASLVSGTWAHCGGRFNSASSRDVSLNGATFVNNATAVTQTGAFDTFRLGLGASATKPLLGSLAHVAMWNVALSQADFVSLAAGANPLTVHPEALIAYLPLNSAEWMKDMIVISADVTINGTLTTAASAPPASFALPRKRPLLVPPPLIVGGPLQDLAHSPQFQPIMAT